MLKLVKKDANKSRQLMLLNQLQGVDTLCRLIVCFRHTYRLVFVTSRQNRPFQDQASIHEAPKRGLHSRQRPLHKSEAQSEPAKQNKGVQTLRTSFNTIRESQPIKPQCIVFIQSSFNNTVLSLSNCKGDIIACASAGSVGFRKSRRSSNVAAHAAGEVLARKALERGIQSVDIHMNGLGFTKESALRGLHLGGLRFTHLRDITSMPHNGCRPPKKRRV